MLNITPSKIDKNSKMNVTCSSELKGINLLKLKLSKDNEIFAEMNDAKTDITWWPGQKSPNKNLQAQNVTFDAKAPKLFFALNGTRDASGTYLCEITYRVDKQGYETVIDSDPFQVHWNSAIQSSGVNLFFIFSIIILIVKLG